MAYSDFTIGKVKQAFGLTTVEGVRFLPTIEAIAPSLTLANFLEESLLVAVATGSEKPVLQMIISPVFLEVYSCVSSGTQWRFLKLEDKTVKVDLADYPLPPVEHILGILVWMVTT